MDGLGHRDKAVYFHTTGNYAAKGSNTITYPALHPNVICVGACDYLGNMSPVSSQGKEVDFLCPGKDVVSTGEYGWENIASLCYIKFYATFYADQKLCHMHLKKFIVDCGDNLIGFSNIVKTVEFY